MPCLIARIILHVLTRLGQTRNDSPHVRQLVYHSRNDNSSASRLSVRYNIVKYGHIHLRPFGVVWCTRIKGCRGVSTRRRQ